MITLSLYLIILLLLTIFFSITDMHYVDLEFVVQDLNTVPSKIPVPVKGRFEHIVYFHRDRFFSSSFALYFLIVWYLRILSVETKKFDFLSHVLFIFVLFCFVLFMKITLHHYFISCTHLYSTILLSLVFVIIEQISFLESKMIIYFNSVLLLNLLHHIDQRYLLKLFSPYFSSFFILHSSLYLLFFHHFFTENLLTPLWIMIKM